MGSSDRQVREDPKWAFGFRAARGIYFLWYFCDDLFSLYRASKPLYPIDRGSDLLEPLV